MNSVDEHTIQVLRRLVEVCRETCDGLNTAAERLEALGLRDLFLRYAAERAVYSGELRAQIFALGGNGDKSAGFGAWLHRGLVHFTTTAVLQDPAALLNRGERGEQAAVEAYHAPLPPALDPGTRALIRRQARGGAASHRCMKLLRDSVLAEESASPSPAL
ncbi:MAG: PA2169 family four-helix-bundle protein [Opitutaceae bacterium]